MWLYLIALLLLLIGGIAAPWPAAASSPSC